MTESVDGSGELPPGWAWARLDDLGRWSGGGTPSKQVRSFWENGSIPWVSPKDMKADYVGTGTDRITDAAVANSTVKLVKAGSVLCVVRSGILRHTFPVAIAECDVTLNQDMRALTSHEGIDSRYLQFFLRSQNQRILRECAKDGTTVSSIDGSRLEQLRVPLAPADEQRRIVLRIEELFGEIEAGEQELEKAREGLTAYRLSILKAAVTGELTRDWRERNVPNETGAGLLAQVLNEQHATIGAACGAKSGWRAKGSKEVGLKTDRISSYALDKSHLGTLPDSWVAVRVGDVGFVQLGRQRAPQHHSGPYMRPYLRVANVFEDRIDVADVMCMNFTPDEFESYKLQAGDILLNEGQSLELVGRAAIYREELPGACFTNTLVRFRAGQSLVPEFALLVFRHWMRDRTFQRIAKITTNIAHLGAGRFADLAFPLPPLSEQHVAVQRATELLSAIDEAEREIGAQADEAKRLRQSILSAAFSGKLAPQDQSEEPANALLERLQIMNSSRRSLDKGNATVERRGKRSGRRRRPSDAVREDML